MVNGNYILYRDTMSSDRMSSESEIVNDHVLVSSLERKFKKRLQRNLVEHDVPFDNETDSDKFEKMNEPKLIRYAINNDIEENFITDKYETCHMNAAEERPRRHNFTKKQKNPSDGSVNYMYSRSSSTSPNANLPTISEHGEQLGSYRVRIMSGENLQLPYESQLEKYFVKPRNSFINSYNGSHPDSLYRVASNDATDGGRMQKLVRALRWPAALLIVCAALAIFVYCLMPSEMDTSKYTLNSTTWESSNAKQSRPETSSAASDTLTTTRSKPGSTKKPIEIDFFENDTEKQYDIVSLIESIAQKETNKPLSVAPIFPTHLTPEVQYGNEKADKNKPRLSKLLQENNVPDSTSKPHITQKPEKPLAINLKEFSLNQAETGTEFSTYKNNKPEQSNHAAVDTQQLHNRPPINISFTSGHSKVFGLGIEDIDKMQSTTQSTVYNTRVSPTLPTWRDGDDTTTKKYPSNPVDVQQCRSPHLALCRGVLPYDLAGPPPIVNGRVITSYIQDLEYIVSTNCSERIRQFVCSLLEPECSPIPLPPKRPCFSLCKAVFDNCEGYIPASLLPAFSCRQYADSNCMMARAPCYSHEFSCTDATCIPSEWVCNHHSDCPDGEDEKDCAPCKPDQFQCGASGGCVQRRWVCDGYQDCPGGEDESDSACYGLFAAGISGAEGAEGAGLAAQADLELGEQEAGSAPAPAVRRRPNTLRAFDDRRRSNARTAVEDSSKELLITSDSSNALKRNFTRRPLPSRLKPYKPKQLAPSVSSEDSSLYQSDKPEIRANNSTKVTTPAIDVQNNEFIEMIRPFQLLQEIEKEIQMASDEESSPKSDRPSFESKENQAATPLIIKSGQVNSKNNNSSKVDRVVEGSASSGREERKKATERARLSSRPTETAQEGEEQAMGGRSSPCPPGELRCVDGLCITLAQLCDGSVDCSDHADEENCS